MIYAPGRFVFIHIPRTGGYSIAQAVGGDVYRAGGVMINLLPFACACPLWTHSTAGEIRDAIPDWDIVRKFAVIRNPWELVASMWRWSQRYERKYESFEEFLKQREDYPIPPGGFWSHYAGEDVTALRFERLMEEWDSMRRYLRLPPVWLPRVNALPGAVEWTEELRYLVSTRCAADIERFGYTCDC